MTGVRRVIVVLLALVAGGCTKTVREDIRTYPTMDPSATLTALVEQAKRVHTLNGQGLITLTRPSGESVRLDGAVAMQPPERARIRAWKFGRGIFDLTVTPEGVWVVVPDDPGRREQMMSAGVSAGKLAKTWSVLSGGFFESPGLTTEERGNKLVVRRKIADEPVVMCEVDRRTLTPRKYTMIDDTGKTRFTLSLEQYKKYGEVVWPTRLMAVSESGTVEVNLSEVEVNPELPANAFVPPRRAEKLP
jgi:outer membrane lipoprotein-sorting protein